MQLSNKDSFSHVFGSAELQKVISKLSLLEDEVEIALASAVNEAAKLSVEMAHKEWNSNLRIDPSYIGNKIYVSRKASRSKASATVSARARRTRSDNFSYRSLLDRKGVRLSVKKGGSGAVIKNAFVIPHAKSNGKPLIVERIKKYQKGEARNFKVGGGFGERFKALYSVSPNQHFKQSRERVAPVALSAAKQQFLRALR
jgi:hypothetical protein